MFIRAGSTPVARTKNRPPCAVFFLVRIIGTRTEADPVRFCLQNALPERKIKDLVPLAAFVQSSTPVARTRKRLRIGYNSESFSVKSACVGINPLRG